VFHYFIILVSVDIEMYLIVQGEYCLKVISNASIRLYNKMNKTDRSKLS